MPFQKGHAGFKKKKESQPTKNINLNQNQSMPSQEPQEEKKLTTSWNGMQFILLNFWDYANPEKSGIGMYERCQERGVPFTSLVSSFYYAPYTYAEGFYDRNLKSPTSNIIDKRPVSLETTAYNVSNLPYHRPRLTKYIEGVDPVSGAPIQKSKTVWEFAELTNPYPIPNLHNQYINKNAAKMVYENAVTPSYSNMLTNIDGVYLPPALSEEEARELLTGVTSYTGQPKNLHITADLYTKEYIRNLAEYKKGEIVEYVLMSFGDEEREDVDGNKMFVAAKDNVRLVPVQKNPDWNPIVYNGMPDQKSKDEYENKYLVISPVYIKKMLKDRADKPHIPTSAQPLLNNWHKLSPEQQKALREQIEIFAGK